MKCLKLVASLAILTTVAMAGEELCTTKSKQCTEGKQDQEIKRPPPVTRERFGYSEDPLLLDGYHEMRMFLEQENYVVLLLDEDKQNSTYLKVFREAAEKYKDKMNFCWASIPKEDEKIKGGQDPADHLAYTMEIKRTEQPLLIGWHGKEHLVAYFTKDLESMTVETIEGYLSDFNEGHYAQYLKSEAPVDNFGKNLTKLVGLNYNQKVKDSTKDYFVMIYSNECIYCKQLAPTWKKLANAFGDSEDIVIAKLDIKKNEVQDLHIGEYPTIIAYRKDNKQEQRYYGDTSLEQLKQWVQGTNEGIGKDEHQRLMDLDMKEYKENIGKDLSDNLQQEIDNYVSQKQGEQSLSTHDQSDL